MKKLTINLLQTNQKIEKEFNKQENLRRNITCYNYDRIGHYANEYTQSSNIILIFIA